MHRQTEGHAHTRALLTRPTLARHVWHARHVRHAQLPPPRRAGRATSTWARPAAEICTVALLIRPRPNSATSPSPPLWRTSAPAPSQTWTAAWRAYWQSPQAPTNRCVTRAAKVTRPCPHPFPTRPQDGSSEIILAEIGTDGAPLATMRLTAEAPELCTSLRIRGRTMLAAYSTGRVRVFDVDAKRCVAVVAAHARWINALEVQYKLVGCQASARNFGQPPPPPPRAQGAPGPRHLCVRLGGRVRAALDGTSRSQGAVALATLYAAG